ncbi:hypothetical protein Rhe02_14910 [Rhizocola hellebori]|uniref:SDR family NAD(P)-dependent oxidoreductase n=1 Tax=Rhizocola hellebori TaxID=1392758 RepID=A0A8J3Q4S2_9ACTN|nr:SDR family NAD(P)-dependent oxidoreductase [Rhizocola hellebori]GIH03424.1 hypothetical protein Rhe02_14910 [Rhizocola hellebori]
MPGASEPIAIISMAGRFPGASTVDEYWDNLCAGIESIAHFTRVGAGPGFVGAEGVVDGYDLFDAGFFGYSPREAQILDPQHRLCLETAWQAFDTAGYDPAAIGAPVGVYLSTSMSSYLIRNLLPDRDLVDLLGGFSLLTHNDKDFLASTVSYKLGLTGPSMAVGTACSSSLVAVHLAVQALHAGECDMALAGGVSLQVPSPQGYTYREDGIYSRDGHCRPFGAGGFGTVGGSGVGVVLLKRWADALRDGDHVHALVLGSAVNNDGAAKMGYTAPGVDGQTEVIAEAQAVAGITADQVGYIEAHGTGTQLGDAIEIQALTRAFRRDTDRRGFCLVGGVKGNIGHLDAAAGIAGLIKAALTVERSMVPASLYCDPPNEHLGLADTPFTLSAATVPWPDDGRPRIAGVSAFGIGGSNAHVVLGQAPAVSRSDNESHVLVLSAHNESTLDAAAADLARFLRAKSPNLAGVAATLAGRRRYPHRLAVKARDAAEAADALEAGVHTDIDWNGYRAPQGAHRVPVPAYPFSRRRFWVDAPEGASFDVATPAHEHEPWAADLDRLCGALALDYLRACAVDTSPDATHTLADLTSRLGVLPVFHRFVDYLMSILVEDGVATVEGDHLRFNDVTVGESGRLAQEIVEHHPAQRGLVELLTYCAASYPKALTKPGEALSVLYPGGRGDLLSDFLGTEPAAPDDVDVAMNLLSRAALGLADQLGRPLRVLEVGAGGGRLTWNLSQLLADRADYLATDIGPLFVEHLREESARRGQAIRTGQLDVSRDPMTQGYRPASYDLIVGLDVVHATSDVRASLSHLTALLAPGGQLGILETTARHRWLSMVWGLSDGWWNFTDDLRHKTPLLDAEEWAKAVTGLGGCEWTVTSAPRRGAALILGRGSTTQDLIDSLPGKEPDPARWCYLPGWRRVALQATTWLPHHCLVLAAGPIGEATAERLRARGTQVTVLRPGDQVVVADADAVAALWAVDGAEPSDQNLGLFAALDVAQALGNRGRQTPTRLLIGTQGAQDVTGGDLTRPAQATALAAAKVIPREYSWVTCVAVDVDSGPDTVDRLVAELLGDASEPMVAYRRGRRWAPTVEPSPLPAITGPVPGLRPGGVYLICGGLGGLGAALAEHLAALPATVVLTRRGALADADYALAQRLGTAGGTVVVEQADITDATRMREVVESCVARFGPITGVIHAAGVPDTAGMIQRRTHADTEAAIAAKVAGTLNLAAALRDHRPEFVLLCSSIGTVLHKLKFGEVGYVAGHEFLQAYAAHRWPDETAVLAVAWTDWLEGGMWARAQQDLSQRYALDGNGLVRPDTDLLRGITTAEGVEIFRRVLTHRPGPVVIVSTQRMDRLLAVHDAYTTDAHAKIVEQLTAAGDGRRRSDLGTDYAPAVTPSQRLVVTIWGELLGIEDIGVDDDFFSAGGDSLIALRMLARVQEQTGVEIPISSLFAHPTVRTLADAVDASAGSAVVVIGDHEEVVL